MSYGGNRLLKVKDGAVLHNERYHMSSNINCDQLNDNIKNLKDFIILALEDSQEVSIENIHFVLNDKEYLVVANIDVSKIKAINVSNILLCGSDKTKRSNKTIEKRDLSSTKIVSKPWGKEFWLQGRGHFYSFKYIVLKAGHQTSLQYHESKIETSYIREGLADLFYIEGQDQEIKTIENREINSVRLEPPLALHVAPPTVHRIRAVEDLCFYEASTPQLDDVVRLSDDANRGSGRIGTEHHNHAVCILTAGEGTRLLPLTETINKSLVPINGRPAISYIFDKIDPSQKVVVATGYKGDVVEEFLKTFYSDFNISFVRVDNFNGAHSGPIYSLYCCREKLQEPFFYVSCDTLWEQDLNDFPDSYDWVGVSNQNNDNKKIYCNVETTSYGIVSKFYNKIDPGKETVSYVGLSFIKDFTKFWGGVENAVSNNETEIFHGYEQFIIDGDLKSHHINWVDVGNFENIQSFTNEKYNFSKPDEFIWFDRGKVIKMFKNKSILEQKFERSKSMSGLVPKDLARSENFLYYSFVEGTVLYKAYRKGFVQEVLSFLKNSFWPSVEVDQAEAVSCLEKFYIDKTKMRISLFKKKYNNWHPRSVHGVKYYSFENELLQSVSSLMENFSKPVIFHGDLHFDNMLYDGNNFYLIDWRESFGGQSAWGDLYYDLAKFYGGFIINYLKIKDNDFNYHESDEVDISFSIAKDEWQEAATKEYEDFIKSHGYNLEFIRLLTTLVFLNMAPLHHYPFDKLLYSLSFELFNKYKGG